MFGTIRKHQSWLWFIIIGVMVIGMITWQNSLGKSGNGQRGGNFGAIDGHVITETEFRNAESEATLQYLVRTHEWPDNAAHSNFDLNRETYYRLFLIQKLEQYNIHTDNDTVAQFANIILRQFGNGQAIPLDALLEQLKPHGITADDFQRFLEHYLSIQQLASVVGVNGRLVTPEEIQSLYMHEYQELAADAVFFTASNYLAKIPDPTPESLAQFYTNQQAEYREPEQMQVSYVLFNVTNLMPEAEQKIGVTNLNRQAEEALTRLGTNGMRFGKTPEEARAKIRELFIQETALSNANTKAISFQNELVAKGPFTASNLNALAREKGLEVKVTKPFDKEYGPSDLHLGSSYPVAELFNLIPPQEPLAPEPIRGTDGVYILAYDKSTPSRIPPLAEIYSRVTADYKYVQAMRLAQMNGHVFAQTATNELAHGKTFSAVANAAKVDPIEVPPFSLNTETLGKIEDLVEPTTFKEVSFGTPVGKTSGFTPTREGGFVVHVRERLPVDQAKMKTQLPEFSKIVRQRREAEAFDMWFNREASAVLRGLPAFQTQPGK
jgi:SurA N-terminal domain